MFIIGWALGAPAVAAGCERKLEVAEVTSAVEQAMTTWTTDRAGFETVAARAVELAGCLADPASPQLVAALHRVGGLRQVAAGTADKAVPFLAASIAAEPDFLPTGPVAGATLDPLWGRARTFPVPPRAPLNLGGLRARVDGLVVDDRPAEGPYMLQVESAGRVAYSAYLVDQPPSIPAGLRAIAATEMAMAAPQARRLTTSSVALARPMPMPKAGGGGGGGSNALLWSGVASGGLAAGLYGTAVVARLQYNRGPSTTTHSLTNGAYFGSIGTAAISGALLSTFLLTR